VLVVSVTKGFRHDVIPTADKMLGNLASKSGKFTVDYVKTEQDMAEKMTAEALQKVDGVIFNNTTGDLPLPDRQGFLDWIKSGKGFVGLHAATDTYAKFPAYTEMIGGLFKTHGAQVMVEVLNQDPLHPATRNMPGSFFYFDEIYQVKNFHRDQVHGLLTLDKHPNTGVPGDYPIAWCKQYGQGRVFYTSLGHRKDVVEDGKKAVEENGNESNIERVNLVEGARFFQQHVLSGILWSLGLEAGDAAPQSTRVKLCAYETQDGFKSLFNGVDLAGWKLRNPSGTRTWSVQNGVLVNEVAKDVHGTDLVTEDKFFNFTVRYEYMVPKGANSGFYLRGRYEIQVHDGYPECQASNTGDGSIYNFAAPAQFASLKPGKWNQVEATIQGMRVTVILNGIKIHDNLEVNRPTGAEIDNKINEPGPIFLQGDHGSVAFRNIRIKALD
jgi:hypothetical protein